MEESFGIIPLRKVEGMWETFIVHHQKGHWGFPKGHAEVSETPQESAARELGEETGLVVVRFMDQEPLFEHYLNKQVTYFIAEVEGELALQTAEIQDGAWLSLAEASSRLTFEGSKQICSQVAKLIV